MPQNVLLRYLKIIESKQEKSKSCSKENEPCSQEIGIGMDSCIIPVQPDNFFLIQTTDFFTPLVDDPYLTGRISACNVLSDLYACGVSKCDNVLMLLGACTKFTGLERDNVVPLMMLGFNEACLEAGTLVRGGHTTINPWPIIGGVATSVSHKDEFVMPINAEIGQKIILTKPLGTQIAVNLYQWLDQNHKFYDQLKKTNKFSDKNLDLRQVAKNMYEDACFSMATLNQKSALAMTKFNASSATDVTGFGILGHAENLAKAQKNKDSLCFEIDTLPVLEHSDFIDGEFDFFKLLKGFSAETSGGLLLTIDEENVDSYCDFVEEATRIRPWVIGSVIARDSKVDDTFAIIKEDVEIVQVVNLCKDERAKIGQPSL